MTNALPVLFSGLIAFVDGGNNGVASAYVLASDAHKALVVFEVSGAPTGDYPPGTTCKQEDGWWTCEITRGVDLVLEPEPSRFVKHTGAKPQVVRPITTDGASDSAWLLRMANVDRTRRRVKPFAEISNKVRLRMDFSWKEAQVCHLDQEEDEEGKFNIFPVRSTESLSGSSGHLQAVAEVVMFTVELPEDASYLSLKQRGSQTGVRFRLNCPAGKCSGLYVSNDGRMDHDGDCDDDFGPHVTEYYRIAEDSTKKKRLLIREREAVPLSMDDSLQTCGAYYKALRSRKAKAYDGLATGAETRVICPMVMFDKP